MFAKLKAYINTTKCSKVPFHLPECTCGERKIYASMEKKLPFLIGFGGFYQFPF